MNIWKHWHVYKLLGYDKYTLSGSAVSLKVEVDTSINIAVSFLRMIHAKKSYSHLLVGDSWKQTDTSFAIALHT